MRHAVNRELTAFELTTRSNNTKLKYIYIYLKGGGASDPAYEMPVTAEEKEKGS